MFGCRKTFFRKYIFSGNVNFRKRKIFPCVWLHFKKFSGKYFLMFGKEEGKDKPRKNIINDRDPRSRSRRCDLAIDAARARDGTISRSTRRDLTTTRSRDRRDASSRRCDLANDASWARDGAISRSTRREIAPLIVILVEGEIAINCAISRRREIAPSIVIFAAIVELEIGAA